MNNKFLFGGLLAVFLPAIVHAASKSGIVGNKNIEVAGKAGDILRIFQNINVIPRCSGREGKVSTWLQQWSKDNGYEVRADSIGNVVIKIPATDGYENSPGIVIQGHMDMVCEKTPDSDHDFSKDPIGFVYEGEWLKADKTTLGADNGIALAMGLALVKEKTAAHPPVELLFTVDEETGLTGASALEPGFIEGRILLNIDSEAEGVFTVGCAGGKTTTIKLPLLFETIPGNHTIYKIIADGMRGGHSGVDINKHRANAIKILTRALHIANNSFKIRIVSIKGGTVENAIPREAEVVFSCEAAQFTRLQKLVSGFEQTVRDEYFSTEKSPAVKLYQVDTAALDSPALNQQNSDKVIGLLMSLPYGVAEMSADLDGIVETSNNIGVVRTNGDFLEIITNQRSSVMSKIDEITSQIEAAAILAGASVKSSKTYPGWRPDMKSPLLKRCVNVYKKLFHKDPAVKVIHAGLECGVIGSKYPDMDMISLGPTIKNPHSPDEKLYIPSIDKVWDFLVALLKSYKTNTKP